MLNNKTIMVTGGTGSFGNALVKNLIRNHKPDRIIIFSRDETKQHDMRLEFNNPLLEFIIGDVRDQDSITNAMKHVDLVFHAAALKQVPSCEFFPMQAVLTNIVGSNNVIEAAIKNGVSKVICLSTDKAVYPLNAMGMTKALMEKVSQSATRGVNNNGKTTIACVRYGNVMYSRGSVIPLFVKQIKDKKPITITEPEMTRFMLSLEKAIDLVLFAFEHARQGDIFVRKAPACTVRDLALALKNIFHSDSPIEIIGVRHGEKIFETLMTMEELSRSDDLGDYYRVRMDTRDLNYNKYYTEGNTEESKFEDYTSHNTYRLSVSEMEKLLLTLPEIQEEL
jgi:UDP-glucose 4-epimerase